MTMNSTSENAPGVASTAGSAPSEGASDSAGPSRNGDLADLHRQAAEALETLADKYKAESRDAQDRATELKAELEATEAKAKKLASEAEQIRAEAERLGHTPDWLGGSAAGPVASAGPGATVSTAPDGQTDEHKAEKPPAPGPGPARGFASSVATTDAPTATGESSDAEDWTPKPFASWRNETKQVSPKILEL